MSGAKRIFIVEDEAFLVMNLRTQLVNAGFDICGTVATGEEAVEWILRNEAPDVVLMDIGLAGELNGIAAARAMARAKKVPIVFMSGYSEPEVRELAADVEIAGFLAKPVSTQSVIACLLTIDRKPSRAGGD